MFVRLRERRESGRINVDTPLKITVAQRVVMARLINLSRHGALLSLAPADEQKVSDLDLGSDARFLIKPRERPAREYTGEIIRLYYRGGMKCIALRFWESYREIE